MDFFDLMVDTETMSTQPDAALLSIGAVFFDLRSETLGPTFCRTIHLGSSAAAGGRIDASTVLWWLRQGDEARKAVAYNGEPIEVVLRDFALWVQETCRVEDCRPWGNSAAFDLTIIRTAYERLGLKAPWLWWNERDFRTVNNMHPNVEYALEEKGEGAHNALTDAIFQAEHLFKIKRARKGTAA